MALKETIRIKILLIKGIRAYGKILIMCTLSRFCIQIIRTSKKVKLLSSANNFKSFSSLYNNSIFHSPAYNGSLQEPLFPRPLNPI